MGQTIQKRTVSVPARYLFIVTGGGVIGTPWYDWIVVPQ